MKINKKVVLPSEWSLQSGVQLTWPHSDTDWVPYLDEAIDCFVAIAREIALRQKLLIVCPSAEEVRQQLHTINWANVQIVELDSNDTWARDHGAITVVEDGKPVLLDFKFNGWGLKFASNKDNLLTQSLFKKGIFINEVDYCNKLNFVLEGGGIESDGEGTILTTSECLLSPNRNGQFSKEEIEDHLKIFFGAERILWLNNGFLEGDDTDSHIDTLARLCNGNTIAYVKCTDDADVHYSALKLMEEELLLLRTAEGKPYNLVALPMADEVWFDDERLPATYANFLIINGAVLLPFYGSPKDEEARVILQDVFPDRVVVGINCLPLIKQHGSLHCVTMQFPVGVL